MEYALLKESIIFLTLKIRYGGIGVGIVRNVALAEGEILRKFGIFVRYYL